MITSLNDRLLRDGIIELRVRVHPAAKKTKLKGQLEDGSWKIDVAAPADEGKANGALITFLAERFDVPKGNIEIVSGVTARMKHLRIVCGSKEA